MLQIRHKLEQVRILHVYMKQSSSVEAIYMKQCQSWICFSFLPYDGSNSSTLIYHVALCIAETEPQDKHWHHLLPDPHLCPAHRAPERHQQRA